MTLEELLREVWGWDAERAVTASRRYFCNVEDCADDDRVRVVLSAIKYGSARVGLAWDGRDVGIRLAEVTVEDAGAFREFVAAARRYAVARGVDLEERIPESCNYLGKWIIDEVLALGV